MEDIGKVWDLWKAEKEIGIGSYGVVYRCTKTCGDQTQYAAVKVIEIPKNEFDVDKLLVEGMTLEQSKSYYKEIVDEYVGEIRIMETLRDCENIVRIQDHTVIEKENGVGWKIYIRMELLTPFIEYMSDKKLSSTETAKFGYDICNALRVCEKHNIIHRDIKPENIFVDSNGNFKLGDFGTAKQFEKTLETYSVQGTYNYMSPEVLNRRKYDSRADIYSLGLVMYYLLNNNRVPFIDPDKQMLRPRDRAIALEKRLTGEKIPAPKNADEIMSHIILKACAFNADDRYASADEMQSELASVIGIQRNISAVQRRKLSGKRRILTFATVIAMLLVISIVSTIVLPGILNGKHSAQTVMPKIYQKGDIIKFGSYPQSEIRDEQLIKKLEAIDFEWKSYDYYVKNKTDGRVEKSDFMRYADVELDGEKYRAVTLSAYRPRYSDDETGSEALEFYNEDDMILTYCQYKNGYRGISGGAIYWFKYEPVEWVVLDPEEGLVISRLNIDNQPYNYTSDSDELGYYSSDYERSLIRYWLNNDFYNIAFSEEEKESIVLKEIDNSAHVYEYDDDSTEYDSPNTTDKIYLLSYDEVMNGEYGFELVDDYDLISEDYDKSDGTDYAFCQGLDFEIFRGWRLRSPCSTMYSWYVDSMGVIDEATVTLNFGIRPAMRLSFVVSEG